MENLSYIQWVTTGKVASTQLPARHTVQVSRHVLNGAVCPIYSVSHLSMPEGGHSC